MRHGRRRALEVAHGPHAGVEIEHLPQRHVQTADAAADRRRERPFDGDLVCLDRFERVVGQPLAGQLLRFLAGEHLEPDETPLAAVRLRRPPHRTRARWRARCRAGSVAFDERNDRIVAERRGSPFLIVMAVPSEGGFRCVKFGIRIRTLPRRGLGHVPPRRTSACTTAVENPVEKPVDARREPASNRCDVRFAPSWCVRAEAPPQSTRPASTKLTEYTLGTLESMASGDQSPSYCSLIQVGSSHENRYRG